MRFLSLFSGIDAASVAWTPLGWQCVGVAEIEPFPCAVLAHHYPDVPNLGSVTDITDEQIAALGPIDVVVGGSPCQDLSVAGKRAGLAGERSGLFHHQLRIFHAARHLCGARYLLWENVPGAFSSNRGRDFAVVVGEMAGCSLPVPPDGWGTEGVVLGEHGLVEWAVLDAQWFGVAQRRRRVFAVLDVGDWSSRPPILLERDGLRGDSAPSREAGKVAPTIPSRRTSGGGLGTDFDCDGGLIASTGDVPHCLNAGGMGRQDYETETLIAHTLRGEGFDASEDGTGRGTPLVPVAVPLQEVGKRTGVSTTDPRAGIGIGVDGDPMFTLQAGAQHGVAIAAPVPIQNATRGKDQNGLGIGHAGDPMYTLDQGSKHAIAFAADDYKDGGYEACDTARPLTTSADRTRAAPVVTTLAIRGRGDSHNLETRADGTANALLTPNGGRAGIGVGAIHYGMQVRRLTPVECSRLQGFPDDYLLQVPWRGKTPPPDGPMYKALGNSFAVPVVAWIGRQIELASERT